MKRLDIIVPCLNEEACILLFYREVEAVFKAIEHCRFCIYYIDDGSKDRTLEKIKELAALKGEDQVKYLSFSKNFGKEAAIYAGFSYSSGDYAVVMDCDLQHPPSVLPLMLEKLEQGFDCCGGRRRNREGEPVIRSFFSRQFYKVMKWMTKIDMQQGTTDFRMMKRKVVEAVLQVGEKERFSKGIFEWVGFQTEWIDFPNTERAAGITKWSFRGLVFYAVNGIVAFSTAPLRLASVLGALIVSAAFGYGLYIFLCALLLGSDASGFATLLLANLFIGGVVILLLGIIGEYLARIYKEVKKRPLFLLKEANVIREIESEEKCNEKSLNCNSGEGNK